MESKIARVIVFVLVVLLSAGCVSTKEIVLDPTCEAPCWRGISYGMDKADALEIIAEMDDMKVESTENLSHILVSLKARPKFRVFVSFDKDKVVSFDFLDTSRGILTLEEAIEYYGEPDSVVGLFYPGIFQGSDIWLCYFDSGYSLEMKWQRGSSYEYILAPETEVTSIYYIDLQSERADETGDTCLNIASNHAVTDWQGYGSYPTCNPSRYYSCDE